MDNFRTKFEAREGMRQDYVLGWWTEYPSPSVLNTACTLEQYTKARKIWIADEFGIFPYYYKNTFHNDCEFQNVGRVDGSVATLEHFKAELPPGSYCYPYNDRPMWDWWNYFGPRLN